LIFVKYLICGLFVKKGKARLILRGTEPGFGGVACILGFTVGGGAAGIENSKIVTHV